jgi:rhamnosyltransferase subunit B
MQFVVSALGSAGDVHPFIAISQALQARGHRVQMIASPYFEARIQRAGVEFTPLGAAGDFERLLQRPELWHPRRSLFFLLDELLKRLPEAFAVTAAISQPRDTVLVGSSLSWGLRLVQEHSGLPGATVHLAPICLPSATRPSVLPGLGDLSWLPVWALRALQSAAERLLVDRWVAPRLNRLRAELGLGPVRRVLSRWMHSPDLVIGAWPDWFAPPQPDWPAQTQTSGFPLFHEPCQGLAGELDPSLEAFLGAGPAPIGITPGSAMAHGAAFFAKAVDACTSLGQRALLVSPFRDQLPSMLPAGAMHVPYAPFSALLPRLGALVHHGGIGTGAQALAAGIPQLVVPFAHDQFDNAARLRRLGVAVTLDTAAPVADWRAALGGLLDAPDRDVALRRNAERMTIEGPAASRIADRLEALGRASR